MAALPTAPPAIAVSLHGLLEREHWPRSHPPASHATCQRGMAQEGEASGDRHLPHRTNRCLLGLLGSAVVIAGLGREDNPECAPQGGGYHPWGT